MNRELFLAILAMDSYNRGYGAGISGLVARDSNSGGVTDAVELTNLDELRLPEVPVSPAAFDICAVEDKFGHDRDRHALNSARKPANDSFIERSAA